jgi:hypothetical protein
MYIKQLIKFLLLHITVKVNKNINNIVYVSVIFLTDGRFLNEQKYFRITASYQHIFQ